MKQSQREPSYDDTKAAQVKRHCTIPEGFGSAMSHPGLRFVTFTEDIRTSEPTFSDMKTEEAAFPWSKAA